MANDIIVSEEVNLYSDGKILAYTDGTYYKHEFSMIDADGKATVISDDVSKYIRVDNSTLLYISDGDLYSYDGKEKNKKSKMVKSDVDGIWSKNSAEIDKTFSLN